MSFRTVLGISISFLKAICKRPSIPGGKSVSISMGSSMGVQNRGGCWLCRLRRLRQGVKRHCTLYCVFFASPHTLNVCVCASVTLSLFAVGREPKGN